MLKQTFHTINVLMIRFNIVTSFRSWSDNLLIRFVKETTYRIMLISNSMSCSKTANLLTTPNNPTLPFSGLCYPSGNTTITCPTTITRSTRDNERPCSSSIILMFKPKVKLIGKSVLISQLTTETQPSFESRSNSLLPSERTTIGYGIIIVNTSPMYASFARSTRHTELVLPMIPESIRPYTPASKANADIIITRVPI